MRFDAAKAMALAEEFAPPRLIRSDGERRAADLLSRQFEEAGWAVERRDASPPKSGAFLIFLAILVAWLWLATGRSIPWMAELPRLGLVTIALVMFFRVAIDTANRYQAAGLKGSPQHAIAARPGEAEAPVRVVFLTRLYTRNSRRLEMLARAVLALALGLGGLLWTGWFAGLVRTRPWAGPALLACHWGTVLILFRIPKAVPEPPGAGDNRSGLAALAELARSWPKGGSPRVEARFVATSARRDLARIVAEEWPRKPTLVLVLELPGVGDGIVIDGRGPAAGLAREAADSLWLPHRAAAWGGFPISVVAFAGRGIRYVCVRGDRSPDEIRPAGLAAVAQLATEIALRWGRDGVKGVQGESLAMSSQKPG